MQINLYNLYLQYGKTENASKTDLSSLRLKQQLTSYVPRLEELTTGQKEALVLRLADKRARARAVEKAKFVKDRFRVAQFENSSLSNRKPKKELKKKRYNDLKLLKIKQKKTIYYLRADKKQEKLMKMMQCLGPVASKQKILSGLLRKTKKQKLNAVKRSRLCNRMSEGDIKTNESF